MMIVGIGALTFPLFFDVQALVLAAGHDGQVVWIAAQTVRTEMVDDMPSRNGLDEDAVVVTMSVDQTLTIRIRHPAVAAGSNGTLPNPAVGVWVYQKVGGRISA